MDMHGSQVRASAQKGQKGQNSQGTQAELQAHICLRAWVCLQSHSRCSDGVVTLRARAAGTAAARPERAEEEKEAARRPPSNVGESRHAHARPLVRVPYWTPVQRAYTATS